MDGNGENAHRKSKQTFHKARAGSGRVVLPVADKILKVDVFCPCFRLKMSVHTFCPLVFCYTILSRATSLGAQSYGGVRT